MLPVPGRSGVVHAVLVGGRRSTAAKHHLDGNTTERMAAGLIAWRGMFRRCNPAAGVGDHRRRGRQLTGQSSATLNHQVRGG